jgi:hypothetical protein
MEHKKMSNALPYASAAQNSEDVGNQIASPIPISFKKSINK